MQTLQGGNTAIDSVNLSFTPTGPIKKALDEQNAIRWNNFYRGRIASAWNAVQQGHYKTRKNGKQDTTIQNGRWISLLHYGTVSSNYGKQEKMTNMVGTLYKKKKKKEHYYYNAHAPCMSN